MSAVPPDQHHHNEGHSVVDHHHIHALRNTASKTLPKLAAGRLAGTTSDFDQVALPYMKYQIFIAGTTTRTQRYVNFYRTLQ